MTKRISSTLFWVVLTDLLVAGNTVADGDPQRGAQLYRQCVACHSLAAEEHLTGPSLAGVVGRPAGAAGDFGRYSEALRRSGITWTKENLDAWLKGPGELVPGTSMRIPGIPDPAARRDIIAFLETGDPSGESGEEDRAGMISGMGSSRLVDLKELDPNQQVTAIKYCRDAYHVTLGTGDTFTFWEFNLRFKSDSSAKGPSKGKPAILGAGMRGDRASVIFGDPAEISVFIQKEC